MSHLVLFWSGPAFGQFEPNYRPAEFNRGKEFPNFFLPEAYREVPENQIPSDVLLKARRQLEGALQSVFSRMVIPIVFDGEQHVTFVRYFKHIQDRISAETKIMPSGGVVRAAIGFIYQQVYDGMRRIPPIPPEQTFSEIIRGSEDIPGYRIRGIGSDFDLLVDMESGDFEKVKHEVQRITNSAECQFGCRDIRGDYKQTLFTISDVREYREQIRRSARQGGATIDLLAFDLQKGRFREPPDIDYIVTDLLCGYYRYLGPADQKFVEDWQKQTVRGIRPLVENPFLAVKNDYLLREELAALQRDIDSNREISPKALEQFNKLKRNIRYSAAHNRIYRGVVGSLERAILAINDSLHKTGRIYLPEFIDSFSIDSRGGSRSELNGIPPSLLTPVDEFIRTRTDDGVVYHGTPSIDAALSILRQGFIVSGGRNDQGTSCHGRGAYFDSTPAYAERMAGNTGLVLSHHIRNNPKLNILDLSKHGKHRAIARIRAEAKRRGEDLHELLAREHGIDIIDETYILVQNADAIVPNGDIPMLIHAAAALVDNSNARLSSRIDAFLDFQKLRRYGIALGEQNLPIFPLKDFLSEVRKRLTTEEGLDRSLCSLVDSLCPDENSQHLLLPQEVFEFAFDLVKADQRNAAFQLLRSWAWSVGGRDADEDVTRIFAAIVPSIQTVELPFAKDIDGLLAAAISSLLYNHGTPKHRWQDMELLARSFLNAGLVECCLHIMNIWSQRLPSLSWPPNKLSDHLDQIEAFQALLGKALNRPLVLSVRDLSTAGRLQGIVDRAHSVYLGTTSSDPRYLVYSAHRLAIEAADLLLKDGKLLSPTQQMFLAQLFVSPFPASGNSREDHENSLYYSSLFYAKMRKVFQHLIDHRAFNREVQEFLWAKCEPELRTWFRNVQGSRARFQRLRDKIADYGPFAQVIDYRFGPETVTLLAAAGFPIPETIQRQLTRQLAFRNVLDDAQTKSLQETVVNFYEHGYEPARDELSRMLHSRQAQQNESALAVYSLLGTNNFLPPQIEGRLRALSQDIRFPIARSARNTISTLARHGKLSEDTAVWVMQKARPTIGNQLQEVGTQIVHQAYRTARLTGNSLTWIELLISLVGNYAIAPESIQTLLQTANHPGWNNRAAVTALAEIRLSNPKLEEEVKKQIEATLIWNHNQVDALQTVRTLLERNDLYPDSYLGLFRQLRFYRNDLATSLVNNRRRLSEMIDLLMQHGFESALVQAIPNGADPRRHRYTLSELQGASRIAHMGICGRILRTLPNLKLTRLAH